MAIAIAGCSEDEFDTAPSQLAEVVCPRAYECCSAMQLADNTFAGTDRDSCLDESEDGFEPTFDSLRTSQEEGRSRFNREKFDACLSTIRSSSCEALGTTNHLSGVPGCADFADPLVPVGGSCRHDWECLQGGCNVLPDAETGSCSADTTTTATTAPVGGQCFYSSACSTAGRDPSLIALFAVGLLMLLKRRREAR